MADTQDVPLPTAQMLVEVWDSEVRGPHQANQAYYTADQLRAYGDARAKAMASACAALGWRTPANDARPAAESEEQTQAALAFYNEGTYVLIYTGERARQMALSHASSYALKEE